jgi:hypothetical protein
MHCGANMTLEGYMCGEQSGRFVPVLATVCSWEAAPLHTLHLLRCRPRGLANLWAL